MSNLMQLNANFWEVGNYLNIYVLVKSNPMSSGSSRN